MALSIQLKVLITSFVYGILFAYVLKIQYKLLFNGKLWYKILVNFLFVMDNCLLYFIILKTINNGMFHLYFFFLLILGFLFGNYLIKNRNWHFFVNKQKMSIYFVEKNNHRRYNYGGDGSNDK